MGLFHVVDQTVRCECPILVHSDVMLRSVIFSSFAFHKFMCYFGSVHEYVFRGLCVSAVEFNF